MFKTFFYKLLKFTKLIYFSIENKLNYFKNQYCINLNYSLYYLQVKRAKTEPSETNDKNR